MIAADPPDPNAPIAAFYAALADPSSLQTLVFLNTAGYMIPDENGVFGYNTRVAHAAEIGAAGGVTNARGLAGMYAPLANGGSLNGVTLVSRDVVARMGAVSSANEVNAVLLVPTRFSLGFAKSTDNRRVPSCTKDDNVILSEEAFGHPGSGGSIGFADPAATMSFGYRIDKSGEGIGCSARGQSLVDATYRSLDYRSNASGGWVR